MWRNSFFYHLWLKNRLLLSIIIAYLLAHTLFATWGHQTTPVYIWAMYAPPARHTDSYTFPEITRGEQLCNDPATWKNYSTLMLNYSADNYLRITRQGYTIPSYATFRRLLPFHYQLLNPDSTETAQYPGWLQRYTGAADARKTLTLTEKTVRYGTDGRVKIVHSKKVFSR